MSMTAPSLTTTDGVPGSMFSGTVRPFVLGFTPVVGDAPVISPPANEISAQGNTNAVLSDIARRNAAAQSSKVNEYLQRAMKAESRGNLKMARANYRLALGKAQEPLRTQIRQQMAKHGWK